MNHFNFRNFFCAAARFTFCGLFFFSATLHAQNFISFCDAVDDYYILPTSLVPPVALGLILVQFSIASLLLINLESRLAFAVSAILLGVFAGAASVVLVNGRTPSCGCFGNMSSSLSWNHVIFQGILAVFASLACACNRLESSKSKSDFGSKPIQADSISMTELRRGFSLIEMILVLAIMSALVGMLIPAISSARELARKTSCRNNMRQIGLAMLQHESAMSRFPPGTLGRGVPTRLRFSDHPGYEVDPNAAYYIHDYQNTSALVHLLPSLSESPLYDRIPTICTNPNKTYRRYRDELGQGPDRLIDDLEVQAVAKMTVATFLCPSDNLEFDPPEQYAGGGQPILSTELELDYYAYFSTDVPLAGTNYVACSGASSGAPLSRWEVKQFRGIFLDRPGTRHAEIGDGLSNTIAFGESIGTVEFNVRKRTVSWFFGNMARGRSDLEWMSNRSVRNPALEILGDSVFSNLAGFGSRHPTTVNFVFADGSTRANARSIDFQTLYSLCGMADATITPIEGR